jgi:hypothetical protein
LTNEQNKLYLDNAKSRAKLSRKNHWNNMGQLLETLDKRMETDWFFIWRKVHWEGVDCFDTG